MLDQHHYEPQWLPTPLDGYFAWPMLVICLMSLHLPLLLALPPFNPSLDKYLIAASFFISPFGSLFITRLIKLTLTPIFLHSPMKSVDIGLVLLTIKGINLLGRFSQMIPRRSSSGPLSTVQPELSPIRGSLCPWGGTKTYLTSNSFVYNATLPHDNFGLMPTLNFDDILGRTFLLAQENGECK